MIKGILTEDGSPPAPVPPVLKRVRRVLMGSISRLALGRAMPPLDHRFWARSLALSAIDLGIPLHAGDGGKK
jgi:hypothetical protein